jgi:Fe-S cluster assembly iron-binding protein IscA
MVQVTPQAAQHLSQVRNQRGLSRSAGVRFVPNGSGIGITFSPEPEPGDSVIMAPDLPVYLAAEVATRLEKATIDVAENDGKTKLVVRASQASATGS